MVQVDEAVIAKRKYHSSRALCVRKVGLWGYDSTAKIGFLVEVEDCTAATLLPLIQQNITLGSIIYSDCWSAYGQPGVWNFDAATKLCAPDSKPHTLFCGSCNACAHK